MSAALMRRLMRLVEDASTEANPQLARYISQYPEAVSNDIERLLLDLRHDALENGAEFHWAIGKLPDGRFISVSKRALEEWGIPIVREGTSDDF